MTFFSLKKRVRRGLPLELDLTLEVLEKDEVLQKNVPPEVAVAELQVHQLEEKQESMLICYNRKATSEDIKTQ